MDEKSTTPYEHLAQGRAARRSRGGSRNVQGTSKHGADHGRLQQLREEEAVAIRRQRDRLEYTLSPQGWRDELDVAYRQRRSIIFVIAGMIVMQTFWSSSWAWVVFFAVLGVYSLLAGVRIGAISGFSFAAWFATSRAWPIWYFHHENIRQAIALWCISTFALVIVWKKDGAEQITLRRKEGGQ